MMKVEVISRETIKPSSPTPHHLRTFNLSFLDQLTPPYYMPIMFFYTMDDGDRQVHTVESISRCLKKSLSETLTHFYPLAGRIKGDVSVDCNDHGIDYFESRVNGQLSAIIRRADVDVLKQFLPFELYYTGIGSGPQVLLAIQVNIFDCGGLVIGVCISHKIADASSVDTFVNQWAATARGASEAAGPLFELATLFPCRDLSEFISPHTWISREKIVTKRFVFDASKIAGLRAKFSHGSRVEHPTRVEAVMAFFWERFMDVAEAKEGPVRGYAALQAVNLRSRMIPPLPQHSFGNISSTTIASWTVEGKKERPDLVGQLRDAIRKIDGDYVRKLQCEDGYLNSLRVDGKRFSKGELVLLNFSSLCRFKFYDVDFGWGKPAWVSTTTLPFKNLVVFMDTRSGDGIEAWVNMLEDEMAEFDGVEELHTFLDSEMGTTFRW